MRPLRRPLPSSTRLASRLSFNGCLRHYGDLGGTASPGELSHPGRRTRWLLEVAFGPFYRQAEPILLILCAGQLVFAWGGSPMMA